MTSPSNKAVQVVKKRREEKVAKNSDEEDEDWFSGGDGSQGALSPGSPLSALSPTAGKSRYKMYWSQLLGCKIQSERKKRKPKVLVLCDLFGMFLKMDGIEKEERLSMINVVIALLRKDGLVNSRAPIAESVRQRVAEERRYFRFSDDSTANILAQKKKNAAVLQAVTAELEVTKDLVKGIDDRDRRRRKREAIREAAAKMGLTLEEFEAARAKAGNRGKDDRKGKKSGSSADLKSSPLKRSDTMRGDSPLASPMRGGAPQFLSFSLRDDTFLQSMAGHLEKDKFFHQHVRVDEYRRVNLKVLAAIGMESEDGDAGFAENTAEEDAELRAKLVAHMERVSDAVYDKALNDSALSKRLDERKLKEMVYSYLLEYLDTLPALDKDGQRTSIASLKDIYKMGRKQANQLAINRIQLRFTLERAVSSNDAFLGKNELMRVSALLRSVMYVKAWMLLYKHAETSKQMRAIGEKIGFNSNNSLRAKVLRALGDNAAYNKETRVKLADAAKFFAKSVTIRDECFRLWVHAHRLSNQVELSRFKSLATGAQDLKHRHLEAWQRVVRNKKRAFARWCNGTLLWALREWSEVVLSLRGFEVEAEGKLGARLLATGKVLKGMIMSAWLELVRKKRRALRRWTQSALVHAWQVWACECRERAELYAQVLVQCARVAALLKSSWRDLCFHAWSSAVLKDRRARARFVNATLYMCLSSWRDLTREQVRRRRILDNITVRIARHAEIMVFREYAFVVSERILTRKTLNNLISMWVDKGRRAGFRSLYSYAQRRRESRQIVAEGRVRTLQSRLHHAFVALQIHRAEAVRVRVVLARIRWRPAAVALEVWGRVVMDVMFAQQQALAAKSPIIARFLKRAMVDAFAAWHKRAAEHVRRRRIIARMRTRMLYAAAIRALVQWAAYMEDAVQQRHEELLHCVHEALANGDLAHLQQALARQFQLPHVRRKYKAQSMREIMAEVLAEEGAAPETVSLLAPLYPDYRHTGRDATDATDLAPVASSHAYVSPSARFRDEGEAVVRYKALEGRKHLQLAFARALQRADVLDRQGGVRWLAPPERSAALQRDAMGEVMEEAHAELKLRERLRLLYKAQRMDTGQQTTEAGHGGRGGVTPGGREELSHSDATQWVLGVLPSDKIVNKMGVGRTHGACSYASSLPVPVTDLNCSSMEVRLGARHRIWDPYDPLPPRVFKSESASAAAPNANDLEAANGKRARSALGAADLVGFKEDGYTANASKYREKTAPRLVHDRLQHFRSVLGLTEPRPPAHAAVLVAPETAAHRDTGQCGKSADALRSRGEVQSKLRWSESRDAQGDGIAFKLLRKHASSAAMSERQSRALARHAAPPRMSSCEAGGGSSLPRVKAAVSAGDALHVEQFPAPASVWGHWDEVGRVGKGDSRGGLYGGAHTALGLVSSSAQHSSAGPLAVNRAARVLEKSQRLLAQLSSS